MTSKVPLATEVTLVVEDSGEGSAIVFVHGLWMSRRFFRAQAEHFSQTYRVIVPDLRGHGDSEKVLAGHTVQSYARDLRALFDAIGVTNPVLVGWSMGAMVVWEYLRLFGQSDVAGIVIVEQPPSDFAWDDYEFGVFTLEAMRDMVEQVQTEQRKVAEDFAQAMLHVPDPKTTAWMVHEMLKVPPAIAVSIMVSQTLQDYRALLPEIDLPTLVLFGEDPKLTNPQAGRFIAEHVPRAQFHTFAASSHCPFIEEAELFNRELDRFLDQLLVRPSDTSSSGGT